jgi:hypothetical protein
VIAAWTCSGSGVVGCTRRVGEQDGEGEAGLEQGEGLADAHALAAAEREVGEARELAAKLGGPARGVEALGIRVVAGVAVHDPLRHHDDRAAGDAVAGDLVVLEGLAAERGDRRVQAQGLEDDLLVQLQARDVGEGRRGWRGRRARRRGRRRAPGDARAGGGRT